MIVDESSINKRNTLRLWCVLLLTCPAL